MNIKAIVEIIPHIDKRLIYSEVKDAFEVVEWQSRMGLMGGFKGFYGWIDSYGTPPNNHLDVMVITDKAVEYNQSIDCKIVGVFKNCFGDHKFVAIDRDRNEKDLYELSVEEQESLFKIYKGDYEGDAWLGYDGAMSLIKAYTPDIKVRNYKV